MANLSGTQGNDTLIGTNKSDTIIGYAGKDTINGQNGNDVIYGDNVSSNTSSGNSASKTFADKTTGLYDISDASEITLNLSEFTHSTGYTSSIGYYVLDEEGNVIQAAVIAPNVKDIDSLEFNIDTQGGAKLGTFLIVDGNAKGFEAGDVSFNFDGHKPTITQTTSTGSVSTDWVYFSGTDENKDGKEHKAVVGNRESWEDMYNLGDNDVNDTAYTLSLTKTQSTDGRILTNDGTYDVSGKPSVSLDFSDFSHGTGFQNSVGYYLQDEAGNIISSHIVIANVKEMHENKIGESLKIDVDTSGAASLSTFIIVDGAYKGFDVGDVNIQLSDKPTISQGNVSTDWIYFADQSKNKDGDDHLNEGGNRFYWEDLKNLGDHDFDDTAYNLDVFENTEPTEFAHEHTGLYDISEDASLTLNFSQFTHSSGFTSSVGYYILDENGNIIKAEVVAPNVKDVESLLVDIDTEGGEQLGTFIIVDGNHKGFEAGSVEINLNGHKPSITQTVDEQTVTTDWIYFSEANRNADGKDHKANVGNRESWEDKYNLGDNDVNDTAYTLTIIKGSDDDNDEFIVDDALRSSTSENSNYDDTIHGGGGDDTIYGGVGDDLINGGAGNDTIFGDNGNHDIQTFDAPEAERLLTTDGTYDVEGLPSITLDFSDFSHGTGFQNSIGYMLKDADGNIISSHVAIANVRQMHENDMGESLVIDVETEGAATLSTFIIVDGAYKGFDIGEVSIEHSPPAVPTVSQGSIHTDWVYFSEQSINKDGDDHMLEGGNRFYWEDLKHLGDHDFDDTVYNLDVYENKAPDVFVDNAKGLYDISDESTVTLNFSEFTHSSAFTSSIGYYILDDQGNVISSSIVAPNVKDVDSLVVEVDTQGGEELGTFIVVDGSWKGFEAGDVSFNFDGHKPTVTQTINGETVTTDWIYFSEADLNADGKDHTANVGNREAWEDKYHLGDKDMNDTAYTLDIVKGSSDLGVDGGIGSVTYNDTIQGGEGNDTIQGGLGDDIISGNDGNDVIFGDTGKENPDLTTVVTTERTLHNDDGHFDIEGKDSVTLDFSNFSHGTGFQNSIGYVLKDADGNIMSAYVAIANVKHMHEHKLGESLSLSIDTEGASTLSTFIIVDGAYKGFDVGEVAFNMSSISDAVVSQGEKHTDWVYFSEKELNKDGDDHLLEGGNRFYWEDLKNLGDHDFNDTAYTLNITSTVSTTVNVDPSLASGDDVISGGNGDDQINGEGGDDIIHGDAGNDRIIGGEGDDTLYGGDGDDFISGNQGDDIIYGGDGDDILHGTGGNDSLFGGAGNDYLEAGYENDIIMDGGTGRDIYVGSEGNDTMVFDIEDFQGVDGNAYNGSRGFDKLLAEGDANIDFTGKSYGNDASQAKPIAQIEAVVAGEGDQTVTVNAFAIAAQSDDYQTTTNVDPGDWDGFVAYLGEGNDTFNLEAVTWSYDADAPVSAELSADQIAFMNLTDSQVSELDAYVFTRSSGESITIWTDAENVYANGDELL